MLEVKYIGEVNYSEGLNLQETLFNQLIQEKMNDGKSSFPMTLILCQHKPVYTLGKNGKKENLLPLAQDCGADFYQTNRGGDITFHGPGQLVGYPILDLERLGMGLAKYIDRLEEAVMHTVEDYGIKGHRYKGASGVWLEVDDPSRIRKICALGIRSSRWVTMHGFALNINTDLKYFDFINPCGFQDKGVTSMAKELGQTMDFEEVMRKFINYFIQVFEIESHKIEEGQMSV